MTALITGITGQDGSYLAKLLLSKGYKVYGITRDILNYNTKNLDYLGISNDVEFIEMTQAEKERIEKIIKKVKPTEVYNLSSQSSVGYSFVDPFNTLSYNILSVLYWLEAIKKLNPGIKFYQASSSEMFGNVRLENLPLKESLIFHPASPYGVSKASAHWLAVNYRESNNLFTACGILFNHESPLREANFVVKKIINAAVKFKMGIRKEKLSLGNTKVQRDWGYAPDYVQAMWLMLQQQKPDDFLICSGNVMSLESLVNMVFKELDLDTNKYITTDVSLMRPKDLEVIFGDNTKARSVLKWDYNLSNESLIKQLIKDEYDFIKWEMNSSYAA